MIQFGTPWILWGALTALIPILIHLFGKRRTRKVAFSSLRFLQTLQREQIRTLKLKQILLLILRTLLLLLLVLAFANPRYAPSSARDIENEAAVVVFDNTISSSAETPEGTFLDELKSVAGDIAKYRDSESPVIWTSLMDPDSRFIQSAGERPAAAYDEIQPKYGQVNLEAYLKSLRSWLNDEGYGAVDLFLCTDGQSAQYAALRNLDLSDWNGSRWYIVQPELHTGDAGIASVDFSDELLQPGIPIPLGVNVARSDSNNPMATPVKVSRNGEAVGQSLIDWGESLDKNQQFEIPVPESGFLQMQISLGEDGFEANNSWYLNANVPERLNVVLVSNSPDARYFLETALRSFAKHGSHMDFESITPAQMSTRLSSPVDLVVLSDVLLNPDQKRLVQETVSNGTGLMIFPGPYTRQQPEYRVTKNLPVYNHYHALKSNAYLQVEQINWRNPVFRNLSEKEQSQIRKPEVSQYFSLGTGNYSSVMQLANGAPLLAETSLGQGKVWLWTTAPELTWSDLPRRGMFIPMLLRSLYYLSGNKVQYQNQLITGDAIQYTPAADWSGSELRLITPQGKSVVLPVTTGEVKFAETDQPGQYSIYDGEKLLAVFSVNIPQDERDMTYLSREQWQVLLGDQFGDYLRPTDQTLNLQNAGLARGTPLWQWLLALALLCVAGEMLLTRMDTSGGEENELNG